MSVPASFHASGLGAKASVALAFAFAASVRRVYRLTGYHAPSKLHSYGVIGCDAPRSRVQA